MQRIMLATAPGGFITKQYIPPLGLGYMAASLASIGYEPFILDAHVLGLSLEDTVRRVAEVKPQAVGITATTHNRFPAIDLANALKKELGVLVVVGGPHFGTTAEDALRRVPGIDVVVRGEGEKALPEVLEAHFAGHSLASVPGIVFRDSDGRVVTTPDRPLNMNLDSVPWPAWRLFSMDAYTGTVEGEFQTRALGTISSRGCPNDCVFCARTAMGRRLLRRRNPKDFVDEVEFLHREFGIQGFDFWDDTITMVRAHVEAICQDLIARQMRIIWHADSRVNTIDERLFALMQEAGCVSLGFGVESGSDRILKVIKKGITVEQARRAVRTAAAMGFREVKAFFMFNHPEETREDIIRTLDLMEEMVGYGKNVVVPFGFTRVYPGTHIETLARVQGILPGDFSWNASRRFARGAVAVGDPTIPLYESSKIPFEEAKALVLRHRARRRDLEENLRAGFRKLTRVRTADDMGALAREGMAYVREWTRR